MANIKVAVINESTVLEDPEVKAAVPALQIQVHDHFAPAWGIDADLTFVPEGETPSPGAWWLSILDDSDQADALGYHEITDEGLPHGKVFAEADQMMGYPWTVTASHELLEMLADPNSHLTVFVETQPYGGYLYANEVCDPCEAEKFRYAIDGTHVSDFVYPAWFEPLREIGTAQFDYCHYTHAPFQCLPGCHTDVYDINLCTWHTFWGEGRPYRYEVPPSIGSRGERRRRPRHRWRRSAVRRANGNPPRAPSLSSEPAIDSLRRLVSSLRELEETITRLGI